MRRRTRLVLATALAAAIGAAVGLVAFRVAIVESLLTEALIAQGVPAPRLAVAEMGWQTSRLADIRLGDADEIILRELRLDYGLSGLLAGRLDRVTVSGLALALDLTGDGPPFGSLQPLLAGGEGDGNGGGKAPVPNMELDDLRVVARTAGGIVQATGSGRLSGREDGVAAELDLPEIALAGTPLASGRLAVDLTAGRGDASLNVRALAGDFAIDATLGLEDPLGAHRWRLDLAARAAADSAIWTAWPGPRPSTGRAEITLRGKGTAPPLAELRSASNPLQLLLAHEAAGYVHLSADDVSVPEYVDGLSMAAELTLKSLDGEAVVTLRDAATMTATHVSPSWLLGLGVPDGVAAAAARGFTVHIQPLGEQYPVAILERDGEALTVALDGTLQLAVPGTMDVSMALPADLRITSEHLKGRLRAPTEVRLATLRHKDVGELLAPVTIAIPEAHVDMGLDGPDGGDVDYRVLLEAPAVRTRLAKNGIEAVIAPGHVIVAPRRIDVQGAGLDVPAYAITAAGINAAIALAGAETRADIRVAALHHTSPNSLLAPVALAGTIRGEGSRWQGAMTGHGPGGVGQMKITGQHDTASGKGSATVTVPRLEFSPGGAQPGALVPALLVLQGVTGAVDGEAQLSWSKGKVQGSSGLALRDIGFDSPQARVAGLDLRLQLDSIVPPGSPPRQTLTVHRLEPGLPLDRLAVTFQIQPADPPRLAIETGEVFFGSGRLAVDGLVLDPAAPQQRVELRVEDLSLSELFAILGIEGLSGEGGLSGTIPIHFSENSVVIEDGHLAADAPGIVRFRSEQAAQILAGQGESLDLVLRALEDFHYDELTVDLAKTAADVGRMKLSLLGKNPAVLEGYPFRFNISIEANTGKLITALTTIYRVPNDLLRRAWTPGR